MNLSEEIEQKQDDTRTRIILATYKAVRKYGLDGVRIQRISEMAELSPGALYRYFASKDELMAECFTYVDKQVARIYDRMQFDFNTVLSEPAETVKTLWLPYFRFWTAHPDETVFYHRFRDSELFPEYNKQRDIGYFEKFIGIVRTFQQLFPDLSQMNQDLLWLHVLTSTVMYAKYVAQGILPNTAETEESIFRLQFSGLQAYLH